MTAPQRFSQALDELIELIKPDRSILAAVLCGSLSHDTVWEKSDIDLVLVTLDDHKIDSAGVSLYADGVNVHAILIPRTEFRKTVEGGARNGFFHALLAKGRLVYTHDPTIAALCSRLSEVGERDTQLQLFRAGTAATAPLYKARKWFLTRGDLDYTALWILYTATPLARIEVVSARLIADREVILQALKLNPAFFQLIYTNVLNSKKTRKNVQAALEAVEAYLAERAPSLFEPLLEYLHEIGEARSCTELENHFKRNFDVGGVTSACEYLADLGLIAKVSTSVQLTKRSNVVVQEMAFVALGEHD